MKSYKHSIKFFRDQKIKKKSCKKPLTNFRVAMIGIKKLKKSI